MNAKELPIKGKWWAIALASSTHPTGVEYLLVYDADEDIVYIADKKLSLDEFFVANKAWKKRALHLAKKYGVKLQDGYPEFLKTKPWFKQA